jgi:sensor c-di-GMP phosphodiesterase-like protein
MSGYPGVIVTLFWLGPAGNPSERTLMPPPTNFRAIIERSTAYFQPIVDLNTGQILGAETLVRFVDPDGTLRGPGGIIERIEENVDELEALMWCLFRSIAEKAGPLLDRHRGFYISVNVPPVILDPGRLKPIIEHFNLVRYADRLVCEITERQALTDTGREALIQARPLGFRVAMDDFGTGQSSLKQLIGLPLDILKIDKSQIDPLMKDPTADRLLRGVVALAAALRVKVIAEGVETREQAFFLRAAGVDAGQGWLWSKAVPPEELERLIGSGFPEHPRWK